MRILLMDKDGDGLGVAQRLALEGHDVSFWSASDRFDKALAGIVDRPSDWRTAAKSSDFIILSCVGLGRLESELARFNAPVLGCSPVLDRIELDRGAGMRLFQTAGIDIPETHEWQTPKEADKITKGSEWQKGWVLKPNGNKGAEQTTIVNDPTQWGRALSAISPESGGILQRVVSGIEVSTEGWFNGRRYVLPMNHTFEEKRFLAGGLGPNTGCSGNVVINAGKGDKLTKRTVEPLAGFLKHIDYRGPFDVNCIVDKDKAYALEATSRMGYDAVEAFIEGLEEPAGQFLYNIATGVERDMKLTEQTMIAVRMTIPPYPFRNPDRTGDGEPISGITDEALAHLFLSDVQRDGDGYRTASSDGILLKATAIGSVREGSERSTDYTYEARRRVYRLLDKITVPSKQYRIDIGERVNKDIAQLREWGWL
jgi:phosphoribosylamine--glycine ligase